MHLLGPPPSRNVVAIVAKPMEVVEVVDMVDLVDTVEAVEPETGMIVNAPNAIMTALPQLHAGSGNVLRRRETMAVTTSAFASSADSQVMLKSIESPTNV